MATAMASARKGMTSSATATSRVSAIRSSRVSSTLPPLLIPTERRGTWWPFTTTRRDSNGPMKSTSATVQLSRSAPELHCHPSTDRAPGLRCHHTGNRAPSRYSARVQPWRRRRIALTGEETRFREKCPRKVSSHPTRWRHRCAVEGEATFTSAARPHVGRTGAQGLRQKLEEPRAEAGRGFRFNYLPVVSSDSQTPPRSEVRRSRVRKLVPPGRECSQP